MTWFSSQLKISKPLMQMSWSSSAKSDRIKFSEWAKKQFAVSNCRQHILIMLVKIHTFLLVEKKVFPMVYWIVLNIGLYPNSMYWTNIKSSSDGLCSAINRRKTRFAAVNQRKGFNFPGFFRPMKRLFYHFKLNLSSLS